METISQKSEISNKKSIDTFNGLLQINNDRMEEYERAIKETKETDLKALFPQMKETICKCRQELVVEVKRLGGIPNEGTHNTGMLYRAWMDTKAVLIGRDRKAILASCEDTEYVAVKTYEDALRNYSENDSIHQMLYRQYILIKADYDKVKDLSDAIRVRSFWN